jgi:O-antigen ligase
MDFQLILSKIFDFFSISDSRNRLIYLTAIFFLVFVFTLPFIPVSSTLPKFSASDIFFPVIAMLVLWKNKIKDLLYISGFTITLLFSVYILFTILMNYNSNSYRDYFEIFKYFKFGFVFVFFATLTFEFNYKKIFNVIFYFILIFNFCHYFDIFNFNYYIEPLYSSGLHLKYFGINTLGLPDSKRMLGTLGNPNNNAILFLFFCIFYFPGPSSKLKENIHFYLSFLGLVACQSRTGFLAFIIVFISYIVLNGMPWKKLLVHVLVLVFCIFSFSVVENTLNYALDFAQDDTISIDEAAGTKYLSTLASEDIENTGSVTHRLYVWNYLFEMILENPVIGHGPNKNFFYENKIYSENEYVLIIYRYGFLGVVLYLFWLTNFAIKSFSFRRTHLGACVLFFTIGLLVISLTNNPISESTIFILFAVISGLFVNSLRKSATLNEKVIIDRK